MWEIIGNKRFATLVLHDVKKNDTLYLDIKEIKRINVQKDYEKYKIVIYYNGGYSEIPIDTVELAKIIAENLIAEIGKRR